MWLKLIHSIVLGCCCAGLVLQEPTRHLLVDGGSYYMAIAECPFSSASLNYTAFCYCWMTAADTFDVNLCSVPGPTLVIYSGSEVTITFTNYLRGPGTVHSAVTNQYKYLTMSNIHSHGLHVDPSQDDVTMVIPPNGGSLKYIYTIPDDHYPGSHWIHPHHHGSVSIQVHLGLFLQVIIEYNPNSVIYDAQNDILKDMEDTSMIIHSVYGVDVSSCDLSTVCDGDEVNAYTKCLDGEECKGAATVLDPNLIISVCFELCAFNSIQRGYYKYDMLTRTDNTIYHFINGQESPELELISGIYRRLRLLNTNNQQTIQLSLPNECEWQLIALDGIYLQQNTPRDLSGSTYNNELILFPATRADVAVKCNIYGTYIVYTSKEDHSYSAWNTHQLRRVDGSIALFSLSVTETDDSSIIGVTDISALTFPSKPNYLSNLIDLSDDEIVRVCPCAQMNQSNMDIKYHQLPNDNDCIASLSLNNDASSLNGLEFSLLSPVNLYKKDEVYEITIYSTGHPYHQHIQPFQIQTEDNIFFGEQGDWRDTYGFTDRSDGIYKIRTKITDFTGVIIQHCHWLPHEDMGMMGWTYATDDDIEYQNCQYPMLYGGGCIKDGDLKCIQNSDCCNESVCGPDNICKQPRVYDMSFIVGILI